MSKRKQNKFVVDDIVFAKLHRYPFWPAKIISILGNRSRIRYNVMFFGPFHGTGIVNEKNVCLYRENKGLYGIPKIDNFKNASFNAALNEVEVYLTYSNTGHCAAHDANEIVEDDVFCSEPDVNRNSLERNYQKSTSADSAYDDDIYQGLEGSAEDLVFTCNEPHSNRRELTILDHFEEHTILDNVAKKLQRYENLDEIDIETSLALAAELGNALLNDNNGMKVEMVRLSRENKQLGLLLEEEQKKNESLTRRMNEVLSNQSEYCSELEETLSINEQIIGELTEKNICSQREITFLKNKLNTEQTVKDDLLAQYESEQLFFTSRIKEIESENSSLKKKIGTYSKSGDNQSEMEIIELKRQIDDMIENEKIIKEELDEKNRLIQNVTSMQVEFLDNMFDLENFLESLLANIKNILEIERPIPISNQNFKCLENNSHTNEIPNDSTKIDELSEHRCDQIVVEDSIDFIRNKVVDNEADKRRPICAYELKDGETLEEFFRSKCEKYLNSDENNITISICKEEQFTNNTKNTMACYDRGWSEHPSSASASSSSSMLLKMIQAQAQEEQRRRIQTQEELQRRAYHDTWFPWESLCTGAPAPAPSPPSPVPATQSLWGNDVWAPPPPPDTWAPPGLAPRPPPRLDDPANPDLDIGLDYDPFRSLSNIWAPHSSPNNFWKPPTTN